MNWKVRHEGSPQSIELTWEELLEGLQNGAWEATDEVMGPADTTWVAIENHPALEEIAADLEPPPPRTYDDETRLDMNALIDVCLVLLIFFILTTTVAVMQKRLEAPSLEQGQPKVAVVTKAQVAEQMIHVKAVMANGHPVIYVEKEEVPLNRLVAALKRFVSDKRKTDLLLEHDNSVSHDTVVKILDAAKEVGMTRLRWLVP
jgi:biopolymer transport protein ExbD